MRAAAPPQNAGTQVAAEGASGRREEKQGARGDSRGEEAETALTASGKVAEWGEGEGEYRKTAM